MARLTLDTPAGTRVAAGLGLQKLTMHGTYEGRSVVKRTAHNHATIQLADLHVGMIRWDEAPSILVRVLSDELADFDIIN